MRKAQNGEQVGQVGVQLQCRVQESLGLKAALQGIGGLPEIPMVQRQFHIRDFCTGVFCSQTEKGLSDGLVHASQQINHTPRLGSAGQLNESFVLQISDRQEHGEDFARRHVFTQTTQDSLEVV